MFKFTEPYSYNFNMVATILEIENDKIKAKKIKFEGEG